MQNITAAKLRRAADLKDRIESLTQELDSIFAEPPKRTWKMSKKSRMRIAAAAKARWARVKAQ